MPLEKQIAEQMERVKSLQQEVFGRTPAKEDAKRPAELKKQRVAGVREAIARVEREKKAAIQRYDTEIRALEDELKILEKRTDLDLAGQQGGGGSAGRLVAKEVNPKISTKTTRRKRTDQ